jgi:hypothetical protein
MNGPGAVLVALEDVLFVSNGLVPICQYRGVRFGVPFWMLEPGSTIHVPGDRGRLVLARSVAEWLQLVPPLWPDARTVP